MQLRILRALSNTFWTEYMHVLYVVWGIEHWSCYLHPIIWTCSAKNIFLNYKLKKNIWTVHVHLGHFYICYINFNTLSSRNLLLYFFVEDSYMYRCIIWKLLSNRMKEVTKEWQWLWTRCTLYRFNRCVDGVICRRRVGLWVKSNPLPV